VRLKLELQHPNEAFQALAEFDETHPE